MRPTSRRWGLATAVLAAIVAASPRTARPQSTPVEDLRRQVETMRKQLETMQQQIRKQEELIEKLSAEKVPPSPQVVAPAPAEAAAPPPTVAQAPPAAREPWSPSQPIRILQGSRGYLNLSFDSLTDFGWSTRSDVTSLQRGDHDPLQRGFTLPNEEIFLDGAIDPYFKGFADIVFKLDEDNETAVELEEVYLMTTSLPWRLQAKAGQFFTEFGRINQQHPHAWDFVDQPLVIGRMFGPEGLRNPGARLSWLAPTPFYSELFLTAQNSHGGTAFSFRNAEEETLFGRPPLGRCVRGVGDLLYTSRYVASFDLTDAQTIVTGLSGSFGPNASGNHTRTQIYGGDVYWKWKPSWQVGGFPFVSWQTEVLGRRYEAGAARVAQDGGPILLLPRENLFDWGAYSQVLWGFRPRWAAGLRGEWVSGDSGAFAADESRADRFRVSPDVTFYPTEFSKIRLQYNFDHGQLLGDDSSLWVQLEFLLGEHAAHKF